LTSTLLQRRLRQRLLIQPMCRAYAIDSEPLAPGPQARLTAAIFLNLAYWMPAHAQESRWERS
jgi:hypothetical protein